MGAQRAAPALAVTIENQDENSYKYSIQEGEYHDEGEVAGNLILLELSNQLNPTFLIPRSLNLSRIQEYL